MLKSFVLLFYYFKTDVVNKYWYHLLTTYEKKCNFKVEQPEGAVLPEYDIEKVLKSIK